jgi:hypothetical protein
LCRESTSFFLSAKTWMAGTSPAMTNLNNRARHYFPARTYLFI